MKILKGKFLSPVILSDRQSEAEAIVSKDGITLIEVLVAIAIMAIVGSLVVPQFLRIDPKRERNAALNNLNALVSMARNSAVTTQRVHRMVFDIATGRVITEIALPKKNDDGSLAFAVPQQLGNFRSIMLPKQLKIRNFFIEGVDEMNQPDRTTNRVWFYITAQGRAQAVVITVVDTYELHSGKPKSFTLSLNPFSVSFDAYET
jgi:prepilin-type N-terminal cleavage/methylation domain-containing protein